MSHRQRADGRYVGAPRPRTRWYSGDTVLLYGQDRTATVCVRGIG